jgi:hypothetical protein
MVTDYLFGAAHQMMIVLFELEASSKKEKEICQALVISLSLIYQV